MVVGSVYSLCSLLQLSSSSPAKSFANVPLEANWSHLDRTFFPRFFPSSAGLEELAPHFAGRAHSNLARAEDKVGNLDSRSLLNSTTHGGHLASVYNNSLNAGTASSAYTHSKLNRISRDVRAARSNRKYWARNLLCALISYTPLRKILLAIFSLSPSFNVYFNSPSAFRFVRHTWDSRLCQLSSSVMHHFQHFSERGYTSAKLCWLFPSVFS